MSENTHSERIDLFGSSMFVMVPRVPVRPIPTERTSQATVTLADRQKESVFSWSEERLPAAA